MTHPTHNTRTLAACAKRLRWIASRTTPADMPGWAIVWRFEEGFRLQLEKERHEHDGWIAYGPLTLGDTREIERAIELGRADELAAECLELSLAHQPEDFTDEQLRAISIDQGTQDAARLAFAAIYARWEKRHLKTA